MYRAIERLEVLYERLISKTDEAGKWQAYELMKEGIGPEGIFFYFRLTFPRDFKNPVFRELLRKTVEEAYNEFIKSTHCIESRRD